MSAIAYLGCRDLSHVAADLDEIEDAGIGEVVLCCSESDLEFNGALLPRIVELIHARGLIATFDAWALCGVFGGEALSRFCCVEPEAAQVRADGEIAPDTACPANPRTRAFTVRWLREAASAGADSVLWDEPHFRLVAAPEGQRWTCHCRSCSLFYANTYGEPLPDTLTPRVRQFRDNLLLDLLRTLFAKAHEWGVKNTLCLCPEMADLRDWRAAAMLPGLDRFAIDPYWYGRYPCPEPYVRAQTHRASAAVRGLGIPLQVWLQGCTVPAGREGELVTAARTALDAGADELAVWSFYGGEGMGQLRSDDPAAVWRATGEALRLAKTLRHV